MLWTTEASRHLPGFRSPFLSVADTLPKEIKVAAGHLVEGGQQPGQYGSKLRALFSRSAASRNSSQASMGSMACSYSPFLLFRATLGALGLVLREQGRTRKEI